MPEPTSTGCSRLARVLARLDARIDWERRDRSAGMRVSLEPALDLVRRLGNPHERYPCVHVTGSKGKGSVAALVAAGLQGGGLVVGRYGSPHVERMNERVVLDGRAVEDERLAAALERVLDIREEAEAEGTATAEASWFDLVTAAALLIFAEARVDWAVVEVGLGGRLDSTNVVRGEVCVVTSITLEHTAVLGPTRAHVAREKAGILKAGCTFVSGVVSQPDAPPEDPGRVLREAAARLGLVRREVPDASRGTIAERNRALAAATLAALGERGWSDARGRLLGPHLLDERAVAAAALPGRLERRSLRGVPVVLDGAHTPESLSLVLDELGSDPHLGRPRVVVLSLARDKDMEGILKALANRVDTLLCTTVASGLHRSAPDLCDHALARGLPAEAVSDPAEALERSVAAALPGGWVLVTGSLYVVGAVRSTLQEPAGSISETSR